MKLKLYKLQHVSYNLTRFKLRRLLTGQSVLYQVDPRSLITTADMTAESRAQHCRHIKQRSSFYLVYPHHLTLPLKTILFSNLPITSMQIKLHNVLGGLKTPFVIKWRNLVTYSLIDPCTPYGSVNNKRLKFSVVYSLASLPFIQWSRVPGSIPGGSLGVLDHFYHNKASV